MDIRKILDVVLPPFREPRREKPRDMIYIAQETPDLYTTFTAGATHAISALMLVIYTVIIGTEIGLSQGQLQGFVAVEIVVMGLVTLLQSLTTRVSSGHLVVHIPSIVSMGAFISAATHFGLGAAAGGLMLASLLVIVLSRLLPRMQTLFPPEVAGVLLVLLGLTLVEGGVKRFTGLETGSIEGPVVVSAFSTLIVIVVVSVWAKARLRVFAVVLGVVAGLVAAISTGIFGATEMEIVARQPLFAFPFSEYKPPAPAPELVLGAAVPLLLIQIISALNTLGTGVAIDKLNDQKWRRADLPMIGRLVACQGANWGARRDVITRAGAAVGEALEALQSADMVRGPVTLRASFDEYQLTLVLDYPGSAFALQAKKKLDLSALLDEEGDDALDAAMSKMSSHLIRHLADTVKSSERADRAELVMQFSH